MRIAIVHYHLQPGGVTRIIEHTLQAVSDRGISLAVLTGEAPAMEWPENYRVIPGLQYDAIRAPVSSAELAREMEQQAKDILGAEPDIWHIHNHSLGKNLALPGALQILAARGCHLLLHIHDFAEDGRPANYRLMLDQLGGGQQAVLSRLLYPLADHVHYGVLNRRDHDFLLQAGLPSSCLHRLPNPVQLGDDAAINIPARLIEKEKQLWLYPTRAIRRKNIGELLLWSAITSTDNCFATTMGPLNPKERPRYEAWKRLAASLNLPLQFELASRPGVHFAGLLRQARILVTTSVSEGFGMAFLEPWTVGRPVWGRDLPEITNEFRDAGIKLSGMYERVDVPVQWLGFDRISGKAAAGLQLSYGAYGRSPQQNDLERVLASWIRNGMVDYGRLDEELQEQVLCRVVSHPQDVGLITPSALPDPLDFRENIVENRQVLADRYSLQGYGNRLMAAYRQLTDSTTSELDNLNGEILLDLFLAPERLMLLRVD